MPMADTSHLDAARVRRESLYEALVGLEDALATPIGDGPRWRLRVAMAVDHAAKRVEEHINDVEAPDGFLHQVVREVPRLNRRASKLREDHESLEKDIHSLGVALAELSDDDVTDRGVVIRNKALEFLGCLATHRQRGADLIYEAYQVDIGDSH